MRNTFFIVLLSAFTLLAFTADRNRSNYLIPTGAYMLILNDIDSDDDIDVIVGHKYATITEWGGVSVNRNDNSVFSDCDSLFIEYGMSDISSARLNSNNYEDLFGCFITADPYTVYIKIVYDYSLYGFDSIVNYEIDYPEKIDYFSSGDINGDNHVDIVFAVNNPPFWGVMLNDGTGAFLEPEYYDVEDSFPTGIAVDDIDDNGFDDVIVCGMKVNIHYSSENGFNTVPFFRNRGDARITDFDNDGDNDIIVYSGFPVSITQMFRNLGNNMFDTIPEHYFYAISKEFFISDFNNDNLPDIIYLLSSEPGCVIWYNQGDFQLADSTFIPVEEYEYGQLQDIGCADTDGNGYNDIVVIRLSYIDVPSNLTILFNDGNGHFVDEPVGIDEANNIAENEPAMNCYPNPFSDKLNIKINHTSDAMGILRIFDLQGRVVYEEVGINQDLSWNGVDRGGRECDEGVYIVQLVVDGKVTDVTKIIKY